MTENNYSGSAMCKNCNSKMTSFFVYINNSMIKLLISFNSHPCIAEQITNISPKGIHLVHTNIEILELYGLNLHT
jgi:uncharacterized protein (UPF0212 family)